MMKVEVSRSQAEIDAPAEEVRHDPFPSAPIIPGQKLPPKPERASFTGRAFALCDWGHDQLSHLLDPIFDRKERYLQLLDG